MVFKIVPEGITFVLFYMRGLPRVQKSANFMAMGVIWKIKCKKLSNLIFVVNMEVFLIWGPFFKQTFEILKIQQNLGHIWNFWLLFTLEKCQNREKFAKKNTFTCIEFVISRT